MVSDRKPHRNDEIGPTSEIQPRAAGMKKTPRQPFGIVTEPARHHPRFRAGGTQEISRWCNHRISTPHHLKPPPRPGRAREGHTGSVGQHRRGTFERFSRPCQGASRIGVVARHGSGGSRSLRDLHHRLISFEPPARHIGKTFRMKVT